MSAAGEAVAAAEEEHRGLGLPIAIFASAQFVMVLDSSVMNVSISQIVDDLDTTIQGVQLAITAYTLVMAALMLAGAKLGDILGRDRTFALGLAIYGARLAHHRREPSLGVLLFGWSLVEGIGAALVLPAIVSLIAGTYSGKERALAFGIVGGVAGAAVAAGPLIGGVTTELSWRYVFAGETVIVAVILVLRRRLRPAPAVGEPPKLDVVGVVLSALGLGFVVFGILKSSTWGLIVPRGAPRSEGRRSPRSASRWCRSSSSRASASSPRSRSGRNGASARGSTRCSTARCSGSSSCARGLSTLMMQQLILLGTFFVMPVYLQVVLGLDAFETGKRLFPMSVTMFIAALTGPRLAAGFAPKRVAQAGLLALVAASLLLLGTIDVELSETEFAGAGHLGVGAGLLLSQLGNVIMSSVDRRRQRGRRSPGHRPEPRRLARHGADRRGADRGADERLLRPGRGQPRGRAAGARARQVAERHPGHTGGRRRAAVADAGVPDQAKAIADDYGDAQPRV